MMSNVDDAIKYICSRIDPITNIDETVFVDEENIILSELNEDKNFNFNKIQDKIRYHYNFERKISSLVFHKIYTELKKEKNFTYERMKELIKEDLENIKKEKLKSFDLYFPINVKPEKKISKFSLKDVTVDFLSDKKIINSILKDKKIKQEFRSNKRFNFDKVILCKISLRGRNRRYAINKAEKIFDFILGVIGYVETYERYSRTLIGFPKPISKLNKYYIFVFENCKYSSFLYFENCEEPINRVNLTSEQIKLINKYIKRAIKAKQKERIFNLFTDYLKGLSDKNLDYSFLSFWRIIELGILKDKNQKHAEIIAILKSLIIELKPRTKYKLDMFYRLRNSFVHEGIADINQFDRNGIKTFAQMIINIYLNTLYNYKDEEIKLFYYYVKRKHNIKQHLKMAKKINLLIKQTKRGQK